LDGVFGTAHNSISNNQQNEIISKLKNTDYHFMCVTFYFLTYSKYHNTEEIKKKDSGQKLLTHVS